MATPVILNRCSLPRSLRSLLDLLGDEAGMRLVEARGGTRLAVPVRATVEHELFHLLGAEAFAHLVAEYGGRHLQLPKADKVLQQAKHAAVLRMYFDEHCPVPRIALTLNYTRTRVYQIIQASGSDLVNGDLFPELLPDADPRNGHEAV